MAHHAHVHRRGFAAALLSCGVLIATAVNVFADGSQNLYPSGATGSRANTEWRTGSYGAGAITRRTLLHAYATTGEFLLVGSTAMGLGEADIRATKQFPEQRRFRARRSASAPASHSRVRSRAAPRNSRDRTPSPAVESPTATHPVITRRRQRAFTASR
jgi:hypothetical protein